MDSRFPVGRFEAPARVEAADRAEWIEQVAVLPVQLRAAVAELDEEGMRTPYREGGWTVRQVLHHVPDSHMNAYIRFKIALTEERPTIRAYDQDGWAALVDSETTPDDVSLQLLAALHARWVVLMRSMMEADWRRVFVHPEHGTEFTLATALALYAWHGRHHLGHVGIVSRNS